MLLLFCLPVPMKCKHPDLWQRIENLLMNLPHFTEVFHRGILKTNMTFNLSKNVPPGGCTAAQCCMICIFESFVLSFTCFFPSFSTLAIDILPGSKPTSSQSSASFFFKKSTSLFRLSSCWKTHNGLMEAHCSFLGPIDHAKCLQRPFIEVSGSSRHVKSRTFWERGKNLGYGAVTTLYFRFSIFGFPRNAAWYGLHALDRPDEFLFNQSIRLFRKFCTPFLSAAYSCTPLLVHIHPLRFLHYLNWNWIVAFIFTFATTSLPWGLGAYNNYILIIP